MQSPHIKGRGLDVSHLNAEAVFNQIFGAEQPQIMKIYSEKLKSTGVVSQVIQPWMIFGVNLSNLSATNPARQQYGNGFIQNGLTPGVEYIYHHIHIIATQ